MTRAWWVVRLIAVGAVLGGVGAVLGALHDLANGRTVVGWIVMTCGVLGAAFGAAALLAAARARR